MLRSTGKCQRKQGTEKDCTDALVSTKLCSLFSALCFSKGKLEIPQLPYRVEFRGTSTATTPHQQGTDKTQKSSLNTPSTTAPRETCLLFHYFFRLFYDGTTMSWPPCSCTLFLPNFSTEVQRYTINYQKIYSYLHRMHAPVKILCLVHSLPTTN